MKPLWTYALATSMLCLAGVGSAHAQMQAQAVTVHLKCDVTFVQSGTTAVMELSLNEAEKTARVVRPHPTRPQIREWDATFLANEVVFGHVWNRYTVNRETLDYARTTKNHNSKAMQIEETGRCERMQPAARQF